MASTSPKRPSRIGLIWLGLSKVLGLACLVVLFALIGMICVDVVARYLFNSPLSGAYELTELLLATLIFMALPLTTQAREHIEVELLDGIANRGFRLLTLFASVGVTSIVFAVIAYQIWHHALRLQRFGQVTDSLEIPLYLIGFLGAASCLLSAVVIYLPRHIPNALDRSRD
ncbi:hypothetical protein GCM10011316_06550 [Roseibium aquae]|uniref:TRAP transporter small permease protein n=1 Tax=Roseibium aquae TaxID=1323746 RepID=A0A916TBB1_9HYPH|nr:TRAP transporter small permease [Roseibium aquae]GGB37136.1 hypothetical protein GCM10011316_06550 [Roseibium aquae]